MFMQMFCTFSQYVIYYDHLTPHKCLGLPAFVCEDVDNPETRADGEHGERGESSSELGIATFAVGEPAKFYFNLNAQHYCIAKNTWLK